MVYLFKWYISFSFSCMLITLTVIALFTTSYTNGLFLQVVNAPFLLSYKWLMHFILQMLNAYYPANA